MTKELYFAPELFELIRLGIKKQTRRPIIPQPWRDDGTTLWWKQDDGTIGINIHGPKFNKKEVVKAVCSVTKEIILIQIRDIHADSLWGITYREAFISGVTNDCRNPENITYGNVVNREFRHASWRMAYMNLWNEFYKEKGFDWDSNPFVWVYDFERFQGSLNFSHGFEGSRRIHYAR
jgi:hypothetical protein